MLSFLSILCYASSAYSTSTVKLNQAELPSDGHDEEKGDGDVEPLHAAVRFSFRSSVKSDIYMTIYHDVATCRQVSQALTKGVCPR